MKPAPKRGAHRAKALAAGFGAVLEKGHTADR